MKRRSPPSANHANVVHPSKDKIDKIDTSQQQALPHPRAGALDANGVGPYLHDETALRLNPPEFEFGSDKEKLCASSKNDGHYDLLTKHVKVTEEVKENTKLFCAIYTYVRERSEHAAQAAPLKTRCTNGRSEPVMFRCGKSAARNALRAAQTRYERLKRATSGPEHAIRSTDLIDELSLYSLAQHALTR